MGNLLRRLFEWTEHIHTFYWIIQSIPWILEKIGMGTVISFASFQFFVAIIARIRNWPEWIFGLSILIFCGVFFLLLLIIGYKKSKKISHQAPDLKLQKQILQPSWSSYIEDTIFSILWQWKYWSSDLQGYSIDNAINERSLIALCPKCKRELKEEMHSGTFIGSHMKCPNCAFTSTKVFTNYSDFEKDILVEIRGRIRNKEFQNSLEQAYSGSTKTIYAKDLMKRWKMNEIDFINYVANHTPSLYGDRSRRGGYLLAHKITMRSSEHMDERDLVLALKNRQIDDVYFGVDNVDDFEKMHPKLL